MPTGSTGLMGFMPIFYHSLVIESTNTCNAKCAMCYQSAGPKGSDTRGKASLAFNDIERVIRDATKIEQLGRRFHFSGGEAFVNTRECFEAFQIAKDAGYTQISTTTNAFWGRSAARAFEVCDSLRRSGLNIMEISWDVWHQPYIPAEAISNALEACAYNNIFSALRLLSSKRHSVAEALGHIRESAIACTGQISTNPVSPVGRGATSLDPDEIHYTGDVSAKCHTTLNLTISPWGTVHPCCAGADQTEWLAFGNIKEQSIIDIVRKMDRSHLLRQLVFHGASSFVPILERAGLHVLTKHTGVCHLCFDIFSRAEYAKVIREHFENSEADSIWDSLKCFDSFPRVEHSPFRGMESA
jgi:MoaA/NifB/PqqE/SkfB family radical SAM enzyme